MLNISIAEAGGPTLPQTLGIIDASGLASAGFVLATGSPPGLAGLHLDFAFLTWDSILGFTSTSNAVPLDIQP